jgi:leucyl-tRNA synthetase
MDHSIYNHQRIEEKWQEIWDREGAFKSRSIEEDKPKKYILEMLPYPSGKIHMGHLRNYTIGDVMARMYRKMGFNVLYTLGWDAFGLPAENAAIQSGIAPQEWTVANIADMKRQLLPMGFSYDWGREISTCEPEYYKHEQKFFTEFFCPTMCPFRWLFVANYNTHSCRIHL